MARKMLVRSLPANWDVAISHAANGLEAIDACRATSAKVMFLDLQMPEMDGYEVLETLRTENLAPLVIVVSADIQPLARQRVMDMGAIGFVKKPIDAGLIHAMLSQHGMRM